MSGSGRPLNERIRELNENTRFQLVGRVAAIVGTPLIIAGGIWSLSLLTHMSQDLAVVKSQMIDATADRYRGSDATRDFALRDNMIGTNAKAILDLTDRVKTLEYGAARRPEK